jgi:dolichol-phosphate mannosyltransferase
MADSEGVKGPEGSAGLISVVVPVRDERENAALLFREIESVLRDMAPPFEVIFVDDHSVDNTVAVLREISLTNKSVRVLSLSESRGKDEALMMGMLEAAGRIIVTIDGDLQNDPADIPGALKLLEGNDMVCGVRRSRHDPLIKKAASAVAGWVRNSISGDSVPDAGCAFRVFRRECVPVLEKYNRLLYGSAHYFYPSLLKIHGYRVLPVPVGHRARNRGKSKFNLMRGRIISGIRACFMVKRIRRDRIISAM